MHCTLKAWPYPLVVNGRASVYFIGAGRCYWYTPLLGGCDPRFKLYCLFQLFVKFDLCNRKINMSHHSLALSFLFSYGTISRLNSATETDFTKKQNKNSILNCKGWLQMKPHRRNEAVKQAKNFSSTWQWWKAITRWIYITSQIINYQIPGGNTIGFTSNREPLRDYFDFDAALSGWAAYRIIRKHAVTHFNVCCIIV